MSEQHTAEPWRVTRHINIKGSDRSIIESECWGIAASDRDGPYKNKGYFHPSEAEYYIDEIEVVDCPCDMTWQQYEPGFAKEADAARAVACVNALTGIPDPAAALAQAREALKAFAEQADKADACAAIQVPAVAEMLSNDIHYQLACKCRQALSALGGAA